MPMRAEEWSLVDVMNHGADYYPERAAFIFVTHDLLRRTVITFAQLAEFGSRFAAYLKSRQVRRDDRVVILLPNCPERAVIEAGIHYLGAVSVDGVCKRKNASDLAHILRKSRASTIILDSDYSLGEWDTLRRNYIKLYGPNHRITAVTIPNLRLAIHIKRLSYPETGDFLYELRHLHLRTHVADPVPQPEAKCTILVTASGVDRMPKLVVQTHRAMIAASRLYTPRPEKVNTDRYFMNHHLGSTDGHFALTLYPGVTRVLIDDRFGCPKHYEKFVYTAIRKEQCRSAVIPPSLAPALALYFKDKEGEDLQIQKLRTVWLLGDKITKKVVDSALEFSSLAMIAYTSCELIMASVGPVLYPNKFKEFCVGKPVPGAFVRIVGEAGDALGPESKGLVEIRSPLMFTTYIFDPEGTKETLTEDGYTRTGDVGWLDAQGQLYIRKRKADAIHFQGKTLDPEWLEGVIEAFDGVLNATIVLTMHESDKRSRDKEVLCVCLVLSDNGVTVPEIKRQVEKEIFGKSKSPAAKDFAAVRGSIYYLRFESMPLHSVGKVDRIELARQSALRIG